MGLKSTESKNRPGKKNLKPFLFTVPLPSKEKVKNMKKAFLNVMALSLCAVPLFPLKSMAAPPPTRVGQCVKTSVSKVGTRLEDGTTGQPIPGSGTAIQFTNGISLVSYDTVPEAEASRTGDTVKMCLVSVPKNCPPGDNRGKVYTVTNLRTKKTFTLPDSQHVCGGA